MDYLPVELLEQIILPTAWTSSLVCKLWSQICSTRLLSDYRATDYDKYLVYFILTKNLKYVKQLQGKANFNCYDNFPVCCAYYVGDRDIINMFSGPFNFTNLTEKYISCIESILYCDQPQILQQLSDSRAPISTEIYESAWELTCRKPPIAKTAGKAKNKWAALKWVLRSRIGSISKKLETDLISKAALLSKRFDLINPAYKFGPDDLRYIGDLPELVKKYYNADDFYNLVEAAIDMGYAKTLKMLFESDTDYDCEVSFVCNVESLEVIYNAGIIDKNSCLNLLENVIYDGRLSLFKFLLDKALRVEDGEEDLLFILKLVYQRERVNMLNIMMKKSYFQNIAINHSMFVHSRHRPETKLVLVNLILANKALFKQEFKKHLLTEELVDELDLNNNIELLMIAVANNLYNLVILLVKRGVTITKKVRRAAALANKRTRKLLD